MRRYAIVAAFLAGIAIGIMGTLLLSPGADEAAPAAEPSRLKGRVTASEEIGKKTYRSETPAFSLSYPEDLSVKEFDEGQGAATVVFQGPGEDNGFQLFLVPYAEEQITEDRIRKDLKGASMKDPKEIVIGGNTRAILFTSESPMIGESREVWFVKNGYLYEATTYASWETSLAAVLASLSFE